MAVTSKRVQPGQAHRLLRRRFLLPAVAVVMCAFFAVGAVVVVSANRQDTIAAARTRDIVVALVNQQAAELRRIALDYSWWNDAVKNLTGPVDAEWADNNVGPYLYDQFNIHMSLVVSPENRVTYFSRRGERQTRVPLEAVSPLLAISVDAVRQGDPVEPDAVADFFRIGDEVFVTAFGAVTPEGVAPDYDRASRTVLIVARAIDQDLLTGLGAQFKIADFRLDGLDSTGASIEPVHALTVFNNQRSAIATLSWEPPAPGERWLEVMIPGLAALFVVVMALAWRVFDVWRETLVNLLAREQELLDARDTAEAASQAKSSFLANMSHELRTPLNAIIGFSSIMTEQLMGPIGSQKYRGYAHDIQGTARYLLGLIDEVLDIASLESAKAELHESCFPAGDALIEALRLVRGEYANVQFIEEQNQRAETLIVADRTKIVQILTNLLSNAAKASGDGGLVQVAADIPENGGLRFAVSDSGRGLGGKLDQTTLDSLLVPFTRGSAAPAFRTGYGIGLSVSRKLAELHRATVNLENRATGGVLATLTLPADRLRPNEAQLPNVS